MNALGSVVRLDHLQRRDQASVTVGASDLRTLLPRWLEAPALYAAIYAACSGVGAHLIADLGLEHRRAAGEAGKPFWRA